MLQKQKKYYSQDDFLCCVLQHKFLNSAANDSEREAGSSHV